MGGPSLALEMGKMALLKNQSSFDVVAIYEVTFVLCLANTFGMNGVSC